MSQTQSNIWGYHTAILPEIQKTKEGKLPSAILENKKEKNQEEFLRP
jgi:hypothetical protein